jgi:pimeloyl-ACP methyl ester carboxylesterase
VAIVAAATFGLGACTTDAGAGADSPSSTSTTPRVASTTTEPERDVVVGGHHLKAQCAGAGPSVVLVADYGRPMDDVWHELLGELAARTRVCAYDRLGVGRSDPVPARQTFETMAADLDGIITSLGLTRPVIVVAHAMGGPIAATWASRHGADARALLLLDPLPPGYFGPGGALVKALPPRDVADPELSSLWTDLDRYNNPDTNKESLDPASWKAYERLPAMSVPLYNLIEDTPQQWPAAVDATKVNAIWRELQTRVIAMSTPSEQVSVPTADAWPKVIASALGRALQS